MFKKSRKFERPTTKQYFSRTYKISYVSHVHAKKCIAPRIPNIPGYTIGRVYNYKDKYRESIYAVHYSGNPKIFVSSTTVAHLIVQIRRLIEKRTKHIRKIRLGTSPLKTKFYIGGPHYVKK